MPTFPTSVSQRTWSPSVSEAITTTLLRNNVTNPVWLLTSPPMAVLQQTVNSTSLPTNTVTAINMDTEVLDTTNGHQDNSNPSRWYAAVAGWYLVRGGIAYVANALSQTASWTASCRVVNPGLSSSVAIDMNIGCATASDALVMSGAELCVLNAPSATVTNNDYVWLYGLQDTGSTQTTNTNVPSASYMMIRWVGTPTGTAGLSVPSNPSYSDTTPISGAFLNSNMRDAVNYLTFPPMARLTAASTQSIPTAVFPAGNTAVTFQSAAALGAAASSDNYSGWSAITNPTRYTFPRSGRYYVYGQVAFASTLSANWAAGVRVNGGTTQWGGRMGGPTTTSIGQLPNVETWLRVSAGDYVELIATQASGGAVSTIANGTTTSKLIVIWQGS